MRMFFKSIFVLLLFFSHTLSAQPALWQVEKNGITSYLFGTVHVGDESMQGLPDKVIRTLKQSRTLVVEVDIEKLSPRDMQARSQPFMTLPAGQTLRGELSGSNYARLRGYFAEKSIDIERFSQFTPWAVMLTMTQIEYQKAGFSDSHGIDKQILNLAKSQGKTIAELETLEQQLGMFAPLEAYADQMLNDTFKQLGDIDKYFFRLISAWKQGDIKTLESYYHETFDNSEFGRKSEQVMLIERNRKWLGKLDKQLTSEPSFVAVGALHLPTENGLLMLLQNQGFKISKI